MTRQSWQIGCVYKTPFHKFSHICRALYDNAQIQLQLQEYCLPLRRTCMQCAHYKMRFLLATDTAA